MKMKEWKFIHSYKPYLLIKIMRLRYTKYPFYLMKILFLYLILNFLEIHFLFRTILLAFGIEKALLFFHPFIDVAMKNFWIINNILSIVWLKSYTKIEKKMKRINKHLHDDEVEDILIHSLSKRTNIYSQ